MKHYEKRAALTQLEDKLARQQLALDATNAMIELLRTTPVDKDTPKR